MTVIINYFNKKCKVFLPPPIIVDDENREDNERTLTFVYSKNGYNYHIDCKSSNCKTKYIFQESELGIVYFDKSTELLLGSSKSIEKDYEIFLRRAINSWKRHFKDV